MAKDLLLEIGMEEVPARFVRAAAEQLAGKVTKWLDGAHIDYEAAQAYATPRRIAVLVTGVAEKQRDIEEEAKGPSKKIALDENGAWSKAALGFARGQGVTPEQFVIREVAGVEYVYATKRSAGVATSGLLANALTDIVTSMSFPKNMRWGAYDLKFVRPIRWIVALFGSDVVPMHIAGVDAGRATRGHRFLGADAAIAEPADYVRTLREQFVYADIDERQRLIKSQIDELAAANGWQVAVKDDLLEEVLFLVEYPTALFGSFDPDFLRIPQDVLITSMREHQRYFPVLDDKGALLPHFVTVRNGDATSLDQVARGNEKVLRARLSDAAFFYREDQKLPIDSALARLEAVVFHEELGTVGDKVRRIRAIAGALAKAIEADEETAKLADRAAAICKFDLVTQMVYEFPELQGVMGEDYARKAGEPEQVAQAVSDHYRPRFSGDAPPATPIGALVSIADKIDTIAGCFAIGIIPSGSQDPYALRRQAAGIVQIMLDRSLPFKLSTLFDIALATLDNAQLMKQNGDSVRKELYDFFALRVKNVLAERNVRYDIVDAAMGAGIDDVGSVVKRADALAEAARHGEFKATVEAFNRVANLAAKAEANDVAPERFADRAEQELYRSWEEAHARFAGQLAAGQERDALQTLAGLRGPITFFFEQVMVMAEDKDVRDNRLALLLSISRDLKSFADFAKLVLA